jgi:23S rRNA (uracil1939-C5)-methyltransferase
VRASAARSGGLAGMAEAVFEPSSDRVPAPCPHFGSCGGCVLQHLRQEPYVAWKRDQLALSLRRAGFSEQPSIGTVRPPRNSRRRVDLALRRDASGRITLGLHRLRSEAVVDLATCFVLHPVLVALLAPLRAALAALPAIQRIGSAMVNLLDAGPDLLLRTDAALTIEDRGRLAMLARRTGLARVSWALREADPEPVCVLRPPLVTFAGVAISPPPGAFLQASVEGEAAITAAVVAALPVFGRRARIADLYCGCGTLTFPLARRARVSAWDGDMAAVATLGTGIRSAGLTGRIEASARDLARRPLSPAELRSFEAVVLDPPHAGAVRQVEAIAAALTPTVIYVSCNPAALARDARVLAEAGYALTAVTLVDQFVWSARVEAVAVFRAPNSA